MIESAAGGDPWVAFRLFRAENSHHLEEHLEEFFNVAHAQWAQARSAAKCFPSAAVLWSSRTLCL